MTTDTGVSAKKEADARLIEWADWVDSYAGALGYDRVNILKAAQRRAAEDWTPNQYVGSDERDERCLQVDRIVAELDADLQPIVFSKYMRGGPDEVRARRNHMSLSRFKSKVETLRMVVAHGLRWTPASRSA